MNVIPEKALAYVVYNMLDVKLKYSSSIKKGHLTFSYTLFSGSAALWY